MNAPSSSFRSHSPAPSGGRLRGEAGFGLVEAVIAMSLFLVVGTAMADVLSSSATSHGFTVDQTLGQEAADAQIEDVRALPYDSVGTTGGNPPRQRRARPSRPPRSGSRGLAATVTTSIHFVGDGIPDGYNSTTNYKQVVVTVTRNLDGRNLATESTYIAPPTRAPYGGISQVALGVIVTDVGDNQPVPDVPIALTTGPSAPRSDTTDTNGGVLFAGMTANPTSGPTHVLQRRPDASARLRRDARRHQAGAARARADHEPLDPRLPAGDDLRAPDERRQQLHRERDGHRHPGVRAPRRTTPSAETPAGRTRSRTCSPTRYTVHGSRRARPRDAGLISKAVDQRVPNDYPNDLTSSFALDLAAPTGTHVGDGAERDTPIAGVGSHGDRRSERSDPDRHDRRDRRRELPVDPGRNGALHGHRAPTAPRPSSRPASRSRRTSRLRSRSASTPAR